MVFAASRPMATCAHKVNSEFLSGPLMAISLVVKIKPFVELAAYSGKGAILTPAGEYRHRRRLSERIEAYPNGLSVFRGLKFW
jgi:hypothetical protein